LAALADGARERGITLVTSLHQVDAALAQFPRIVGLRDGAVAFDLPTAEVTQARLQALYERHEGELRGESPTPAATAPMQTPAPVVMHCR
jgi:phosphonate transport system ATP-binding protein